MSKRQPRVSSDNPQAKQPAIEADTADVIPKLADPAIGSYRRDNGRLVLVWTNRNGHEVSARASWNIRAGVEAPRGVVLYGNPRDATWLPDRWTLKYFPAGLQRPHLDAWFDYALSYAGDADTHDKRADLPADSTKSPPGLPTPRGLVSHAYMIASRLGLAVARSWPKKRDDCEDELGAVRDTIRQSLQESGPCSPPAHHTNASIVPAVSVDAEDAAILRALASGGPYRLTYSQIAQQTSRPRVGLRTIAQRAPLLLAAGLIARPAGPRSGHTITPAGTAVLRQLNAQPGAR